jgi:hypothetical protein
MVDGKPVRIRGASVRPVYVHRDMQVYGISESELTQLSQMNDSATIYFSLSGAAAAYAVGIWTNAVFYTPESITPLGKLAALFLAPLLIILAAIFGGLAVRTRGDKKAILSALRNQ